MILCAIMTNKRKIQREAKRDAEELNSVHEYLKGREWKIIERLKEDFYDEATQKTIIRHEIGHALYAYYRGNLRNIYFIKQDEVICGGVVYPKKCFRSRFDRIGFSIAGLLGSLSDSDRLKDGILALRDIYDLQWSSGLYYGTDRDFTKMDKYLSDTIFAFRSNRKHIEMMVEEIWKIASPWKYSVVQITEKNFRRIYTETYNNLWILDDTGT